MLPVKASSMHLRSVTSKEVALFRAIEVSTDCVPGDGFEATKALALGMAIFGAESPSA